MTLFFSFLRGINVGGNKMIRMDALRALYESLGFEDVRTLLQSGNVVFRAKSADAAKIEAAIKKTFAMDVTVINRTAEELGQVVKNNPFEGRDLEPAKIAVFFLSEAPKKQLPDFESPEETHLVGRELYIYYPEGLGRSKLSGAVIEKKLIVRATARNWNTVTKLVAMVDG